MSQAAASPRKLTAILAADVAGYSRMMRADQHGTIDMLSLRREILDEAIARRNGRIANTAGDSVISEFGSVVDALHCAIEVQATLAQENQRLPRERRDNAAARGDHARARPAVGGAQGRVRGDGPARARVLRAGRRHPAHAPARGLAHGSRRGAAASPCRMGRAMPRFRSTLTAPRYTTSPATNCAIAA